MNLVLLEIAKTEATLHNLIDAVRMEQEGNTSVDVLGSLLALQDLLDKVDAAVENLN